jgi:hypothetical protein
MGRQIRDDEKFMRPVMKIATLTISETVGETSAYCTSDTFPFRNVTLMSL